MKDSVDADIPDLADVTPQELMLEPGLLSTGDVRVIGARALAYARAGKVRSYDEIGFRWMAAVPVRDATPLQTVRGMHVLAEREPSHGSNPRVERAQGDVVHTRHRPLDLPKDGNYRVENDREMLHFTRRWTDSAGQAQQDVWTFPVSAPPKALARIAEDRDEPRLRGHQIELEDPGMRWLPLLRVVEEGKFPRMQECRAALRARLEADSFYAFLSHRWLTPAEPDPDGRQARYAAWQFVAEVCDALRIASRRGLNTPRRWSGAAGLPIGIAGSPLGEALIVNLIRPNLDQGALAHVLEEIQSVELGDQGVDLAASDSRLEGLRAFLHERPMLSALLSRIYVWYDYSCLPQAPRDQDDDAIFAEALKNLALYQALGRTIVMLDDPDDYISRGWCLLEALTAETDLSQLDLFVGSERRPGRKGRAEHNLEMLLKDRAHIVWRALLDTEVFRVQSADECMGRLDLALGDSRDMPVVFEGLRRVRLPRQVHTDSAELWTGVLPVPEHRYGDAAIIPRDGARLLEGQPVKRVVTVDWTDALRLSAHSRTTMLPFIQIGEDGCHVAVVASCEGEGVLLAGWVLNHVDDLDFPVASLSWIAEDIAPIGEMPCGTLRAWPLRAKSWLIVSTSARFEHGKAANAIIAALTAAGRGYRTLAIDKSVENLVHVKPKPDASLAHLVSIPLRGFPVHQGGLLRPYALEALL